MCIDNIIHKNKQRNLAHALHVKLLVNKNAASFLKQPVPPISCCRPVGIVALLPFSNIFKVYFGALPFADGVILSDFIINL